ncbi:hypothetical protein [Candidatus Tisiphia endosymbiont of Nemotelus uliginosus]|uniref:hypothetical protein n=1 Tax=Candidatus Tisiphia endosymbiont of Nemotelus uliginosus TaxID=3077926 RepID=UPI0035C890DD
MSTINNAATVGNANNIIFEGNTNIVGNIGSADNRFNNIKFTGNNGTAKLTGPIYANNIDFNSNNIVILDNLVTLNGTTHINGNIDLGHNKLIFQDNQNGNSTWGANTVLSTTFYADNTLGTIEIQTPVEAEGVVNITVNDHAVLSREAQKHLFITTGGLLTNANFNVIKTNAYIDWLVEVGNNQNIYLYSLNNAQHVIVGDIYNSG